MRITREYVITIAAQCHRHWQHEVTHQCISGLLGRNSISDGGGRSRVSSEPESTQVEIGIGIENGIAVRILMHTMKEFVPCPGELSRWKLGIRPICHALRHPAIGELGETKFSRVRKKTTLVRVSSGELSLAERETNG
ncbi:hypothetical protein EVAR_45721_1 [Eumeta japonica]|uniref:Uncharacterized protein n=1 Tax=Eumeta variegata TaxID=151549 RepID=A0A4C1WZ97_EUMVA|nr:hypothetical protein EVAR_45721_1 [Eumeta japonica]